VIQPDVAGRADPDALASRRGVVVCWLARGRGGAVRYFTNIGPERGPILYRDNYGAIGVLLAPDNHMPVGMALGFTWDDQGRQLYRLTLRKGGNRPGLWVVVDREFTQVEAQ
jgi:hypothetical protein